MSSSRRPRTPPPAATSLSPDGKKSPDPIHAPAAASSAVPSSAIADSVKKAEPVFECFPPEDMEAISDDDMPEVDSLLIAQNVGHVDEETIDGDISSTPIPKADSDKAAPAAGAEIDAESNLPDSTEAAAACNTAPPAAASLDTELEELEELEEILSDEDIIFEDYADMDIDLNEFGEDIGKTFNPYGIELQPLQCLIDPSISTFDRLVNVKNLSAKLLADRKEFDESGGRLLSLIQLTSRGEKWIESMEQLALILPKALAALHQTLAPTGQMETLQNAIIDWMLHGLDFERAREQVPSTHTVRHIKCGLKLASTLCQCPQSLLMKSIDCGIASRIMSLYSAPHMALSLKLMCLRTLDALLSCPYAMDHLIKTPFIGGSSNGYSYLIQLLEGAQHTRAKVSLSALIRKIHTYEALENVAEIGQMAAQTPAPTPVFRTSGKEIVRRSSAYSISESQDSNSQDSFTVGSGVHSSTVRDNPMEPHVSQLLCSLNDIRRVYRNPQLTIGHLARFLPVQSQFEIAACVNASADPPTGLYAFMKHHRFLNVLVVLLTHPLTNGDPVIVDMVLQLMEDLGNTHHGLCFLAAHPEVTSLMLRALMHSNHPATAPSVAAAAAAGSSEDTRHGDEYANLEEFNSISSSTAHRLGIQLAHSLYVMQCLDALNIHFLTSGKDTPACTECIQLLYSLIFSVTGRLALIFVLSLDNNLDVLVSLMTPDTDPEVESRLKVSAVRGYATELVVFVVRFTERASFYSKYGPILLNLIRQQNEVESPEVSGNKLMSLTRWLEVTCNQQVFTHASGGLMTLCELIKQHADDVQHFPPELIVALRLLCTLSMAPGEQSDPPDGDDYVELKYTYAIVQVFSHDMLNVLVNILLKLCQAYEQPAVHAAILAGPQGSYLLAIVHPALKLIRRLLSQVIRCRDADFRDLTSIPVLLQTYALVSALPQSCMLHAKVADCCADVIATLLAFTQPLPQTRQVGDTAASAEDALARSLWTQMIQEILKYIHSCAGPAAFITGLQVLNEMLPLPLPLTVDSSKSPQRGGKLSADDYQEMLNARKLWSVHLHTLGPHIHEVVTRLCCSGSQLLQLLRKVCVQIADLSPATALVVARSALDSVLAGCLNDANLTSPAAEDAKDKDCKGPQETIPAALICSSHSARVLNFLAGLITHAPLKAAVLQLFRGLQKSDEKYVDFLQYLCVILTTASTTGSHIRRIDY